VNLAIDGAAALSVDGLGVATIAGFTRSPELPTTAGAYSRTGGYSADAFLARLTMLPSGVSRYGASSAGCEGPLAIGVTSWPQAGNATFSVTCHSAPPRSTTGWLLLAALRVEVPTSVLGVDLWVSLVSPPVALRATSSAIGASEVPLPIPNVPAFVGKSVFAQFLWAGPSIPPLCPPLGLSASNALQITIQP
jgi:hypothetical protein